MNGRNVTTEAGPAHSYPGYVPITTQTGLCTVSGVVTKVAWPNGVPPPNGAPYFEFPDQQDFQQQFHQY